MKQEECQHLNLTFFFKNLLRYLRHLKTNPDFDLFWTFGITIAIIFFSMIFLYLKKKSNLKMCAPKQTISLFYYMRKKKIHWTKKRTDLDYYDYLHIHFESVFYAVINTIHRERERERASSPPPLPPKTNLDWYGTVLWVHLELFSLYLDVAPSCCPQFRQQAVSASMNLMQWEQESVEARPRAPENKK